MSESNILTCRGVKLALFGTLAHGYFGLEDETLWDIVTVKIPELAPQLQRVRTSSEDETA